MLFGEAFYLFIVYVPYNITCKLITLLQVHANIVGYKYSIVFSPNLTPNFILR